MDCSDDYVMKSLTLHICHLKKRNCRGLDLYLGIFEMYFLVCTNYFLYGESSVSIFKEVFLLRRILSTLSAHHRFISFTLYILGIVLFVLNLKKGHYRFQFSQFALTHMALLLVVFQSHFIINNIMEGLVWFILPVGLVICNDIFAYLVGITIGRTQLIKISPKKTWEGFIGAFFITIIAGIMLGGLMPNYKYFICPAKNLSFNIFSDINCDKNSVFVPFKLEFGEKVSRFFQIALGKQMSYVLIYPLQLHAVIFSIFASLIAPFGGFFASGFKRAFKVKDFSDSIPGHGGMTDRMDCQFMMGVFINIYYYSFIRTYA
ncbi:phosphatidate cytidylyltransferase, partial [Rozella allomycis CSF55]